MSQSLETRQSISLHYTIQFQLLFLTVAKTIDLRKQSAPAFFHPSVGGDHLHYQCSLVPSLLLLHLTQCVCYNPALKFGSSWQPPRSMFYIKLFFFSFKPTIGLDEAFMVKCALIVGAPIKCCTAHARISARAVLQL